MKWQTPISEIPGPLRLNEKETDRSIAGRRFGRLTALYPWKRTSGRKIAWVVMCDCGRFGSVVRPNLVSGNSVRLPCCPRPTWVGAMRTHGMHQTTTYGSWQAMRNRCNCPSNGSYQKYGAKGTKVCDRWDSFENFLADMGERPAGHSLDRINPYGHYEPSNCRWATPSMQSLNTRKNWDKKNVYKAV